ncbi:hypothetical protein FSO_19140 [Escherichia coli]
MMNPVPWLQMTNMISYQGLVRTFPRTPQFRSLGKALSQHSTECDLPDLLAPPDV